jgi:tetratricopeptide (TPR) repeat protein
MLMQFRVSILLCAAGLAVLLPGTLLAAAAATAEDDLADWANEGKWPRGPQAVDPTAEKQEAKAKRLQSIGDTRQAADQFKRLADVYSESSEAEEGLILAAKNYLAAGDFTHCREEINELRRRYANPTFLDAIGEVEIALGRGFLEGKGEGGTYTLKSRLRKATAIFQRQLDTDPQGRWAADALFGLGQCAQVVGDYTLAIKNYKALLEKYPRSELRAEAEGNIAVCITKREPTPEKTESDTEEAQRRIKQAMDEAGEDVDLDMDALKENEAILKERQARKRYEQALFYEKNSHFRAAEVYLELVKERFPETQWADKAKVELEKLRKR